MTTKGDQFVEKAPGTTEDLHFYYGPYHVPAGQDLNRVDLQVPVRNGFIVSTEPGLRNVSDLSEPVHQEAHIHHAHWLRVKPGHQEDNHTGGLTRWIWGTGDEETKADARPRTNADPKGPVYGGYQGPGNVEPIIYMIHNKTARALNVYMRIDITFIHGNPEQLEKLTGRPHRDLSGVIFGRTYDVPRAPNGDGSHDTAKDDPRGPIEWTSTIDGTIIGAGGHLHPGGLGVTLENLGSPERRCGPTKANHYGGTTLYRGRAVSRHARFSEDFQMTVSRPAWRAPIRKGDRLRLNGTYENRDYAWHDVMAHAGMYIDTEQRPRKGCKPYLVGAAAKKAKRKRHKPDIPKGVFNRQWGSHHEPYCGREFGAEDCDRPEPDRGPGLESSVVNIENFVYTPGDRSLSGPAGAPARVKRGQSVTFFNADQQAAIRHTVTTCRWPCNGSYVANYPLSDGVWDSRTLGYDWVDGSGRTVPFAQTPPDLPVGRYSYFCRIHPWMRGAFEVTD